MTESDPLWTDEDRDLLLALLAEEREECSGCGRPLAETTDPANRGGYEVHREACEACLVLEAEVENDHEHSRPRGVKYMVLRTGGVG